MTEHNTAVTSAFIQSGLISGDKVTVTSINSLFNDKNVGTGKLVTANVSKTGTDAGNYIANTTATTTADIFIAPLEITANVNGKNYG